MSDDLHQQSLGFPLINYLELVDWSERTVGEDKRGSITEQVAPILSLLNIHVKNLPKAYLKKNGETQSSNPVELPAKSIGVFLI